MAMYMYCVETIQNNSPAAMYKCSSSLTNMNPSLREGLPFVSAAAVRRILVIMVGCCIPWVMSCTQMPIVITLSPSFLSFYLVKLFKLLFISIKMYYSVPKNALSILNLRRYKNTVTTSSSLLYYPGYVLYYLRYC